MDVALRCATLIHMGQSLFTTQKSGWRRVFGVFCILLVLLASSAEIVHVHGTGLHNSAGIHPDCSLCVTAHSAVQATVATVVAVTLRTVAKCADPEPIFFRRDLDVRLSIRPPPSVTPSLG
jgi:hypothetical protein